MADELKGGSLWALAGDGDRLSADALADGVEGVLVEQAEDHWGFSVEEMRSVINRWSCSAAPAASYRRRGQTPSSPGESARLAALS